MEYRNKTEITNRVTHVARASGVPFMPEKEARFLSKHDNRRRSGREAKTMTQEQIDNWFTYHTPKPEQLQAYEALRNAAKVFASTINFHMPDCADKTAAIRKVREAVMTANAAVACEGK